jgi:hypothetical protein
MKSLLLPLVFSFLCLGCGVNPVQTAQTPLQKAYATYGVLVVAEIQAAKFVKDTSVPIELRRAVQEADKIAKPNADALLDVAVEAEGIYATVASGEPTIEGRLNAVNQNLLYWIESTEPKLDALKCTLKKEPPTCSQK